MQEGKMTDVQKRAKLLEAFFARLENKHPGIMKKATFLIPSSPIRHRRYDDPLYVPGKLFLVDSLKGLAAPS